MSEIVERVARAILAGHDWTLEPGGEAVGWDTMTFEWQQAYRSMARAAIEAMREPTQEMINMARRSAPYDQDPLATWPLMIDEALR